MGGSYVALAFVRRRLIEPVQRVGLQQLCREKHSHNRSAQPTYGGQGPEKCTLPGRWLSARQDAAAAAARPAAQRPHSATSARAPPSSSASTSASWLKPWQRIWQRRRRRERNKRRQCAPEAGRRPPAEPENPDNTQSEGSRTARRKQHGKRDGPSNYDMIKIITKRLGAQNGSAGVSELG